jgi:hypothetical protein
MEFLAEIPLQPAFKVAGVWNGKAVHHISKQASWGGLLIHRSTGLAILV